jgi:xanthine dehydrogenase YagR molybdenum-binding subunit
MPELRTTQVEFEGRTEERQIIVEEEGVAPWAADAELRIVGQPAPRVDGYARVTGQARYTSDIRLPGMLHARMVRSPHAHARVTAVDSGPAEAMEGVHLVWHRHLPPPVSEFRGRPLFAREVAYEGAEVALVVAADRETAGQAAAAIAVDYEPLPYAVDLAAALADGAPPVLLGTESNLVNPGGDTYERGDAAQGWQAADVRVDLSFTTPAVAHSAFEPHGCVALWEGDQLTLWESTQGVFAAREGVADALGIPLDRVRVICDYMGGGFGAKQGAGRHSVLAAQAARATGRPVRLMHGRAEEQRLGGYRTPTRQRVRLGARRDGTLTCIEHEVWQHTGAHGGRGYSAGGPARSLYACPNVRTVSWGVRANTDRTRAFRAPGYVEGIFALESAMDELARALDLDPLALRLKNYADVDPARDTPYTSKGLRLAYEEGARRSGWWQRAGAGRVEGPWRRGWGMASQIWGGGGGPPAGALVKLQRDGTAEVLAGVQDIGTGTRTALAQIAAEELGLPLDAVRVVVGDTLPAPYGPTSSGSQTLPSAGPAVRAAARALLRDVFDLAAQMLAQAGDGAGLSVDEFGMVAGDVVYGPDPSIRVALKDVAARAGGHTLVGHGARGPNPDGARINTFGAQFAAVDVNVETGALRVREVTAVHDVGRIINPLTATSQVHGGIIQGVGYAAMEEGVVDASTGHVLNDDLEHYKIPTIADVPAMEVAFVDRADAAANSVGAKGLGEPPIIPTAPAIANAVRDALGVRITDLPLTPARLLAALHSAGEARATGEEGDKR